MPGFSGMTFESSGAGTGMDNSIPKVREQEGNADGGEGDERSE